MTDKARKHYHGDSIGKIVAWETVLARNKSLKHKKKFPELAILETVQGGAAWPCTRVAKAYPGEDQVCPLCGHDVYDCWHTIWRGDKIMASQEPAITASNYLIKELAHNRVSFFNRALVSEEELVLNKEFDPMNEYPLQIEAIGLQGGIAAEPPVDPEANNTEPHQTGK